MKWIRVCRKNEVFPQTHIDASLGHKGFGYSGTINMDKATKLVRATEVTPANVLDYKSTEAVIIGDERELYGEKGYAPIRKTLAQKYPYLKLKIMHKRQRNHELKLNEQANNRMYAKERARVEHVFAAIKRVFGFTRVRYRGLERVTRMRKNPKIDMRERELRKQLIPANFGGCLVAGVKRVPDCLRNPATLCRQSAFQVRP